MPKQSRPRVVVLGAGFAGLRAARTLEGEPLDVLLVERNNYHAFLPLLYQVAAAELHPQDIAYPLRTLFAGSPNVRVVFGEATRIDVERRVVELGPRSERYDFLMLAMGSATHFFGVPGAERHAFGLKTLEEALALRNHVLVRFERALHLAHLAERRAATTFVVVGGGPTGVEFAGALAELVRGPLARDFPLAERADGGADSDAASRIVLIEATATLLAGLPERLTSYTHARLRRMGVEVRLGAPVRAVRADGVELDGGEFLPAETVVWTAGVRAERSALGPELAESGGRILVRETLQTLAHPEIYATGDLARIEGSAPPLPQVAPVAIQQGEAAARNILRALRGEPQVAYRYRDQGTMVAIGRNHAVARVFGRSFEGFPAWVLWCLVHIAKLVGVRNRLFVLASWAWSYLFFERIARLIVPRRSGRESERA